MSLLAPELLKPLLALAADPAACKVYEQIAVTIAHVVAALYVGVELALRVDANVVAHELVLEHEVFDRVLLCAHMVLTHKHAVVRHHLEGPAGEGGAAEEGTAGVDTLVVLRDHDVDVFNAEVFGGVDVRGVRLELAVKNGCVAHEAALDGRGTHDFLDQIVVRLHHNDVGIDEPNPFGAWVERKGFSDSRDFGPGL